MMLEQKTKLKLQTIKKDWLTPHYQVSVNNMGLLGFCTVFLQTVSLPSVKPQDNDPSWSQSGEQLCGLLIRDSHNLSPSLPTDRLKQGRALWQQLQRAWQHSLAWKKFLPNTHNRDVCSLQKHLKPGTLYSYFMLSLFALFFLGIINKPIV